jgi:hypothetical protein
MRFVFWLTKATHTHTEYVIRFDGPLQQWLHERASVLRYTYIACIVKGKGLPQQADVAQGVPGRLRPRIFLPLGTTSVVGRQPYAPAAFTPG